MERIDDTGFGGLKIVQRPEDFCYGVDAVLLADFSAGFLKGGRQCQPSEKPGRGQIACDLGTGTGIIPLILSHKTALEKIYGIEFQEQSVACGRKTIEINGLEERLVLVEADVGRLSSEGFGDTTLSGLSGSFDLVTSNPPYFEKGRGIEGKASAKQLARQESSGTLMDFVHTAAGLLRTGGSFCMIHRPARLVDIFWALRTEGLEPKTMRFVTPAPGKEPNMILIQAVKGGGRELHIMESLAVHQASGEYTWEIEQIYERD